MDLRFSYEPKPKISKNLNIFKNEVAERLTDMGKTKATTKNNTATPTKLDILLRNPDIRRWHDNLAQGSPMTAKHTVTILGRFCEEHQMTPMQIADLGMRDIKTVTDMLEDHVTSMESQDHAAGYVASYLRAIKSWLKQFDVEIKRSIKISDKNFAPTIQNERVPNSQEMAEIYSRAGLRESAIISLIGKAGLRPGVLGNHDGTDGLKMKDLPDLVIHEGKIKCIRTPCMVRVRRELSKARHQYFSFLTTSALANITAYLNYRLAYKEPLHGESAVIAPDHIHRTNRGKNTGKNFLTSKYVSMVVWDTFRPRFSWRPYVLRAYFDTQLLIAEANGKIAHDFRVFFMGHKGSMEARYTTNKGILPDALIAEMRQAFTRSEVYIDQTKTDPLLDQKQEAQKAIENATPEQLGQVLEALKVSAIRA